MSKSDRRGILIPLRPKPAEETKKPTDLGHILSRDETGEILDLILEKAVEYVGADGGSIYFIQDLKQESFGGALPKFHKVLRFYRCINNKLASQNMDARFVEIDNNSIAGYVANTGQTVQIKDCYKLGPDAPFKFHSNFDKSHNYKTKSVLAVPIKTHTGQVIGVVQLVNKIKIIKSLNKTKQIISIFSKQDARLVDALASQAAIALENAKLSSEIANLFESFVTASVTAIEARDPSTSGHSDRVAAMTVGLAQTVDQINFGPFKLVKFSPQQVQEIRYASLLHDFGKIGVREKLLLKARKLFPHELETILLRLETIKAKNESRSWRMTAEKLNCSDAKEEMQNAFVHTQGGVDTFNFNVELIKSNIMKANESQVMDGDFDIQTLIKTIQDISKNMGQMVLTEDETKRLSIARGTLSGDERKQIESHVSFTFQFLSQIAWTDNLSGIPNIAHTHHEKLDGSGYPQGLRADQIPVQARMMTVSDIYDALTAMDRPYKKAVSTERAIEILHLEADQGKLDQELLKIFIEKEIYKVAHITKTKRSA